MEDVLSTEAVSTATVPTGTASGLYRLKVKLGSHEFDGEGPHALVHEHFVAFVEAANSSPQSTAKAIPAAQEASSDSVAEGDFAGTWIRAFRQKDDKLSLHVLPQTKTQAADAVLLLLHGYQTLLDRESVSAIELIDAAKQSGLRIDRLDRLPATHRELMFKGGNGRGSRYSLNNRGSARAQEILEEMFE